jgi:hypothetical protein
VPTAEPLVPGPSHLEVETAIANLKKYKLSASDQIPAKLTQACEILFNYWGMYQDTSVRDKY